MKILHVINNLEPGGAQVLLTELILCGLMEKEIEIELLTIYENDRYFFSKLKNKGVVIHELNLKKKYDIRAVCKISRIIKAGNFEIVHVHLFPALYFCGVVSLLNRKVHFIYTEHSINNRRRGKKLLRIADSLAYGRYIAIICVCDLARRSLEEWAPVCINKTHVLYNGTAIQNKNYSHINKNYDFILVGSLRKAKGIDMFLKALKTIETDFDKAVVVGEGELKEELLKISKDLAIDNKVDFLGKREDVDEILEASRVFVISSVWEGVPISLLEAMSHSMPIVAFDIGGIPEVVQNGREAILVRPWDIEVLGNEMKSLLNNGHLALRLGKSAFEKVEKNYSIESCLRALLKIYSGIKN